MNQRTPSRSLWRCPKCRHRFVTAKMSHSCGRYRLADHFRGKPDSLRVTFDSYVAAARRNGPVTVYAQKSRIVLQRRVRFTNVVVRNDWLDAMIWLKRPLVHARLIRTDSFGSLGYGHHFRLAEPDEVDSSITKLLAEAYVIGEPERRKRGETTNAKAGDRRRRRA